MASSKKPFPMKSLTALVVSLPFWYAFFVSQGRPRKVIAGACAFTFLVGLLALYVAWRRANREEDPSHRRSR